MDYITKSVRDDYNSVLVLCRIFEDDHVEFLYFVRDGRGNIWEQTERVAGPEKLYSMLKKVDRLIWSALPHKGRLDPTSRPLSGDDLSLRADIHRFAKFYTNCLLGLWHRSVFNRIKSTPGIDIVEPEMDMTASDFSGPIKFEAVV